LNDSFRHRCTTLIFASGGNLPAPIEIQRGMPIFDVAICMPRSNELMIVVTE
jgi:hypothetical protein